MTVLFFILDNIINFIL